MAILKSYGREVRSVFQLLGDKENDITSSICWALVKCPVFMKGIIKRVCGVDADPEQVTILNLGIDERLKAGDASLVQEIALVTMGNDETKNFYSFATKYCSHHQPLQYAIWDSYVDEVLKYFRNVDGFADFADQDLKDQAKFKSILFQFAAFYGIQQYNLKDLDRYLWQLGKDKFLQKRYQGKKEEAE